MPHKSVCLASSDRRHGLRDRRRAHLGALCTSCCVRQVCHAVHPRHLGRHAVAGLSIARGRPALRACTRPWAKRGILAPSARLRAGISERGGAASACGGRPARLRGRSCDLLQTSIAAGAGRAGAIPGSAVPDGNKRACLRSPAAAAARGAWYKRHPRGQARHGQGDTTRSPPEGVHDARREGSPRRSDAL